MADWRVSGGHGRRLAPGGGRGGAGARGCGSSTSSSAALSLYLSLSPHADSGLVRAFRGEVPILIFMEGIHLLTRSVPATRGMVRIDGTAFVLAGIYLTRFIRSAAGREAGILVEPATAHRLVAVAVLLAANFDGYPPTKWTGVFQDCSEGAIRAGEMTGLEGRFLRAIDFRLVVDSEGFDSFCKVLVRGPRAPSSSSDCASKKRQADAVAGDEGERRCVRARLPLPAVLSN
ncbi:unnamed protein product [Urochloa decumbens]|uniref:Cyclin N-terminal domain-containing protein n=1 Tax=Urochloa decumbens TaxID=240449 RepID=A0ABC9E8K6_9POAL